MKTNFLFYLVLLFKLKHSAENVLFWCTTYHSTARKNTWFHNVILQFASKIEFFLLVLTFLLKCVFLLKGTNFSL